MNMKKFLMMLPLLAMVLVSCESSVKEALNTELDKTLVVLPISGGEDEIKVTANNPFDVVVDDACKDWVKVTPEHSEYPQATFKIIVDSENTTEAVREGVVRVFNKTNVREVRVVQQNKNFDVKNVYGNWEITESPNSPMMVGAKFTFNPDGTCVANMPMMGGAPLPAKYTFAGNIIDIDVNGKHVTIAVDYLLESDMKATVMNKFKCVLRKK